MNWVIASWATITAVALTLGCIHFLVWLNERQAKANLVFSIVAFAIAGMAPIEIGMMLSATAADWAQWVRWFHVPLYFAICGTVVFVLLYFGTGRRWLAGLIIALRSVLLVVNFIAPVNLTYREVLGIVRVPLLGQQVSTVGGAVLNWWQWLPTLSVVLFAIFVVDATITLWRQGGQEARRKAVVVGGSAIAFVLLSIGQTQLMVWGFLLMPVLMSPPFLIMLGAMAVELSRDIFLGKRAQAESEQLRRELTHAGRVSALGQLSAALAHELSQPLGAILRNAEAAEILLRASSPDTEELRAIVSDIRKDDQRAGQVIERLRAMLKRGSIEMHPLSVPELVQDVLSLTRPDAGARQVTLQSAIETGLPQVTGDRVHLSQVLLNLILNGMDAVSQREAGGERIVSIAARQGAGGMVEVAVTDSGTGVSPGMMQKIFDPFVTTKPGGMGIGLAVSRSIVEAHGGRLWAENHAGGGAIFRFTLPGVGYVAA